MCTEKLKSYYARNRKRILEKMNDKYCENSQYRETAKQRAKNRYHEDEAYRTATIKRAKARYRRLKSEWPDDWDFPFSIKQTHYNE